MSEIIHVVLDGEHKKIKASFIHSYLAKHPHAVSFETESDALDYLNAVKNEAPVNKNILNESEDLSDNKQNTQDNTQNRGHGGARKGAGRKRGTRVPLSDETKRKISKSLKGNKNAKKQ